MPKRTDINSVLIIGAGPIIIGQACEFDYSGTQACKALKEEGYRVILVNSNPATIMTDPDSADSIYIEPINWQTIEKIISDLKFACKKNTPEIRVATPYFKPSKNKTKREPDYYLHETDKWLVFPHELEGLSMQEIKENKPELSKLIDQISPLIK